MRIDVLTIFPDMVSTATSVSLLGRAQKAGLLDLRVHDLREGATDSHRTVDDAPFGGGPGMVLKADPVARVVEAAAVPRPLFFLGPSGRPYDQAQAQSLAGLEGFSLLCGRYEGIDQRVIDEMVDDEISIGDYVLAGGEVAALVIIESVGRLVPGVMGNDSSAAEESFSGGLLEYPQYTRPAVWRGRPVPDVLLSGDHGRVARWRRAQALARTAERRPDLLAGLEPMSAEDEALLAEFDL